MNGAEHIGSSLARWTGVDLGVDSPDGLRSSDGPRGASSGVGLIEQELALRVTQLDEIAIDDRDSPDARAGQKIDRGRAERAAAHDEDPAGPEAFLPRLSDSPESGLAGVPVALRCSWQDHGLESRLRSGSGEFAKGRDCPVDVLLAGEAPRREPERALRICPECPVGERGAV